MRRRARRDDRGATTVEAALVIPVALLLFIGIMIFGLRMVYSGLAEHAASTALREATIREGGDYLTQADLAAKVEQMRAVELLGSPSCSDFTEADCSPVELNTAVDGPKHQGTAITVTVHYEVPVLKTVVQLWPFGGFERLATVERTVEGRLE